MSRKEEKKSGLSQSFVTGVVAAVFLITGYQTAVFIHRAAVMKIAADRDEPDTVYVYLPQEEDMSSVRSSGYGGDEIGNLPVRSVRKNSTHSPKVENVRSNLPSPKVESFSFNPNTVSVEDLCRLGFSMKQARSIDNYRQKGGRFRRKSDFADSYVVSDSMYDRLESFIDIPLVDLNAADSAAFDSLPGIGGWFASKMIEHREALGGYTCKEQLMDIYRFDQQKYDALSDLVIVSDPYSYPFWELPADSLRRHPYIRNYETARAIVFFREHNPREAWTIENLASAGVIPQSTASRLTLIVK
jgi:DNA uptake protein ComE-like DNA-binding protein